MAFEFGWFLEQSDFQIGLSRTFVVRKILLESGANRPPNSPGNRGRKGISNLPVGDRLSPREFPRIREALDPRDHPHGQPRQPVDGKIRARRVVGDAHSINAQLPPFCFCPSRSEVRPTVLDRATHDGRSDCPGSIGPTLRPRPAPTPHQIDERLADVRLLAAGRRPPEKLRVPRPHRDQDKPRSQLRNPVVRRLHCSPRGSIWVTMGDE